MITCRRLFAAVSSYEVRSINWHPDLQLQMCVTTVGKIKIAVQQFTKDHHPESAAAAAAAEVYPIIVSVKLNVCESSSNPVIEKGLCHRISPFRPCSLQAV